MDRFFDCSWKPSAVGVFGPSHWKSLLCDETIASLGAIRLRHRTPGLSVISGNHPKRARAKAKNSRYATCRPIAPACLVRLETRQALCALAIPAVAIPADALVWVEFGRTGAEMIPMISGQAEPVAASIGRGGREGYGRQRRQGGGQQSELSHLFSPILSLVGHLT